MINKLFWLMIVAVSLTVGCSTTALHQAAKRGDVNAAKTQFAEGANPNSIDAQGFPPIFYAASAGQTEMVELLLAKGAAVNYRGPSGQLPTALHMAAFHGHKEVVATLIAHGADVNVKTRVACIRGGPVQFTLLDNSPWPWKTPLDLARFNQHDAVCELLLANGAHVGDTNPFRRVIIAPFADAPGSPGSGALMTSCFTTTFFNLLNGEYEIIDTTRVNEALHQIGVSTEGPIQPSDLDRVAKSLGANMVVTGQVTKWRNGNLYSSPMVGFEARCRLVENSTMVWAISHTAEVFMSSLPQRKAELAAPQVCRQAIMNMHTINEYPTL